MIYNQVVHQFDFLFNLKNYDFEDILSKTKLYLKWAEIFNEI